MVQDKAGRRTIKRFHQTASSGFLVQILSMQQNPWAQFLSGFHTGCAPGIPPALPLFFQAPPENVLLHAAYGARDEWSFPFRPGRARFPPSPVCPTPYRHNGASLLWKIPDAAKGIVQHCLHPPAAQTYRSNIPACRLFSALRQLHPARCPAALHTAPRFRDSIRCRLPRAFGTSPHRSRGRPPKFYRNIPGNKRTVAPGFRSSQLHWSVPSAPHFPKEFLPAPDGSHCRLKYLFPASQHRSGCFSRRGQRTDPAHNPPAVRPDIRQAPSRSLPEYNKHQPRDTGACPVYPLRCNKNRFSPMQPASDETAIFP